MDAVEARRSERDWEQPGIERVCPGVYRIPLPLPWPGLRAVNVYAIADSSGLVLIDSGFALPSAEDRLMAALAEIGADLADISRFLVTHIHSDHYTNAVGLRRRYGCEVWLGAGERAALSTLLDPAYSEAADYQARLRGCGAGRVAELIGEQWRREEQHERRLYEPPDGWLTGPGTLSAAGRTLSVVPTPGHTAGHVVFHDERDGLLFAGDHVLSQITPSIAFEPIAPHLPLRNYLDSLRMLLQRPDARLLPAHGPTGPSVHSRVRQLLEHHEHRLARIEAAVTVGASTAYEVANGMAWTRAKRRLDELDPYNQVLGVLETAAHLDVLVAQGRLRCQPVGQVTHYLP